MMKLIKFALKYNLMCVLEVILIPIKLIAFVVWMLYLAFKLKPSKDEWDEIAEDGIEDVIDALRDIYLGYDY